jgi:predicted metal-dependent hydrolase
MTNRLAARSRLLPERSFPAYAYLPGRNPHPVRDPLGHSYGQQTENYGDSGLCRWGFDLFNHGYYWEAHEAWEALWRASEKDSSCRLLFKALILLAAAGIKVREAKAVSAVRHAERAAALLRKLVEMPDQSLFGAIGIPLELLAEKAISTVRAPPILRVTERGKPEAVFAFELGAGIHP